HLHRGFPLAGLHLQALILRRLRDLLWRGVRQRDAVLIARGDGERGGGDEKDVTQGCSPKVPVPALLQAGIRNTISLYYGNPDSHLARRTRDWPGLRAAPSGTAAQGGRRQALQAGERLSAIGRSASGDPRTGGAGRGGRAES